MPRPKKVAGPGPLDKYREVCPFSGKPLQFVETSAGWQVRAPGWVSTQFYRTKEGAQWDFSYNLGEPARSPNPNPEIKVRELEEPDNEIPDKARSIGKFVENASEHLAKEILA